MKVSELGECRTPCAENLEEREPGEDEINLCSHGAVQTLGGGRSPNQNTVMMSDTSLTYKFELYCPFKFRVLVVSCFFPFALFFRA